jgi:hypothetical protein
MYEVSETPVSSDSFDIRYFMNRYDLGESTQL